MCQEYQPRLVPQQYGLKVKLNMHVPEVKLPFKFVYSEKQKAAFLFKSFMIYSGPDYFPFLALARL